MQRRDFLKKSASMVGFGLFSAITPIRAWSEDFDLLFTNALVLDGTGAAAYLADVGLHGDKIASIGNLKNARAYRLMNLEKRALAPGFIDIHSHSEDELLVAPRAQSKIRQGVTTEIVGQDGFSVGPLSVEMKTDLDESYRRRYGLPVNWDSLEGYFEQLARGGSAVNLGSMVGLGTLREYAIGKKNRPATPAEIAQMRKLARKALSQGALGISSGLEYTPGGFASREELIEICKVMPRGSGVYATHMRNEDDSVVEALDEAIAIARGAGVSLHVSHIKCMGRRNWPRLETLFEKIETAGRSGLAVTMDRYPYTAYNTDLDSLFPLWARSGAHSEFVARLHNPEIRSRIRTETLAKVAMIGSWRAVMITSVRSEKNRRLIGKRVADVVGKSDPFDFISRLLIEEKSDVGMCGFAMSEENTARILAHPACMIASDASARAREGVLGRSHPHPRTFGAFPRALGKYVREDHILNLPEAIRKMTSLPAKKLGLEKRGRIQAGYFADLVVFDPDDIRDTATFEEPKQYPVGIECVLVNGQITVEKNTHRGVAAGRILKSVNNRQNH